ncbi:ATP-dependent DNA helicase recG [Methanosarcina lacustris Z-7289]|uniref:ATP-dependent DNA helicase recG n=1 Tax=Methanosarcina lacustris Z-7289 TaxID=1434111 RepID=A0A0E3S3P3_9EURY|nr:hypothetical protein [Methanosarcina lacustris]AKB75604.1 ATP-dependent DNA helicase recG [Methanosarcina lacustris Z-7289]
MKSPTSFSPEIIYKGNLPDKFFVKKIELPFTLFPNGFATDLQLQLTAIREVLVNFLMRSDYFSPIKPRIRIFLVRIEFMNPGPFKYLASIMKKDFTMSRNPTIARIFRAIKLS